MAVDAPAGQSPQPTSNVTVKPWSVGSPCQEQQPPIMLGSAGPIPEKVGYCSTTGQRPPRRRRWSSGPASVPPEATTEMPSRPPPEQAAREHQEECGKDSRHGPATMIAPAGFPTRESKSRPRDLRPQANDVDGAPPWARWARPAAALADPRLSSGPSGDRGVDASRRRGSRASRRRPSWRKRRGRRSRSG